MIKTFMIQDFLHLPWAANISANFRKKSKLPNGILRGLGEIDSRKKPVENLVTLNPGKNGPLGAPI
jgi:hypothetical protein